MISIEQAWQQFESDIKPLVIDQYGNDDSVALSEAWNDYTDSLCRDGEFTALQYHYCPSVDEEMPDDDIEFILDQMNVGFSCHRIAQRPDGLANELERHFSTQVKRGHEAMTVYFSQGSVHTDNPTITDVMYCLFSDYVNESKYHESDFQYWVDDYGYDNDSRQAEKIYRAVIAQSNDIRRLFATDEISDLREMFLEWV